MSAVTERDRLVTARSDAWLAMMDAGPDGDADGALTRAWLAARARIHEYDRYAAERAATE